MRLVAHFFKQMITSRIVVLFVVIHLVLFIYGMSLTGNSPVYHFTNEPLLNKILLLLDLPALIIAGFLQYLISQAYLVHYLWASIINDFIVLICVSIQWALTGHIAEKIFRRIGSK